MKDKKEGTMKIEIELDEHLVRLVNTWLIIEATKDIYKEKMKAFQKFCKDNKLMKKTYIQAGNSRIPCEEYKDKRFPEVLRILQAEKKYQELTRMKK